MEASIKMNGEHFIFDISRLNAPQRDTCVIIIRQGKKNIQVVSECVYAFLLLSSFSEGEMRVNTAALLPFSE